MPKWEGFSQLGIYGTLQELLLKVFLTMPCNYLPCNRANTFVCEQCGFATISTQKLNMHIYSKHEVERHKQCPYCPYKNPILYRVNIHIDNNHPDSEEKNFFCDHCPKSFIYKDSLKKHMDTVKEKGRYNKPKSKKQLSSIPCDYCNEKFTASFFLKKHYKNLHPDQPIIADGHNKCKCLKCPDFFFLEQELDVHLNLEHGVDTEQNYCKICRQRYRDVHNCSLKKQRDKNNEEKYRGKYSCRQCTRVFSAADYLKDHIKSVHENCLDYECEKCKKKFVSKIRLTSHIIQTHSSKVNCGICDKKISNPQQLKRHMVFSHNETEGAIFCVQCPKSVFFKESTYKVHMENKHDIFK